MKYICIYCGAGGACAHGDPHPPLTYNCVVCGFDGKGEGSMWPFGQANLFRATFAAYNRANHRAHCKPLTVYLADGTEHKVQYSPELMSFTHDDMQIRNPMLSECGRTVVDPKVYGFQEWERGGGCLALGKELEDGRYFLLTCSDGICPPLGLYTDLLGLYTKDGDPIALIQAGHIPFDSEE